MHCRQSKDVFSDFQLLVVASSHAQLPSFAPSEQCMGQVSAVSRRAGGGLPPVHGPQCFGIFVVFDCGMSHACSPLFDNLNRAGVVFGWFCVGRAVVCHQSTDPNVFGGRRFKLTANLKNRPLIDHSD